MVVGWAIATEIVPQWHSAVTSACRETYIWGISWNV